MDGSIMAQGVELMLYGMSTVVVFLGLLVLITSAMSGFINRFFPEVQMPVAVPIARPKANPSAQVEDEVVAAITAALVQHRSKKN